MTDWLTTHYSHSEPDDEPWHIYLKRQHRDAVSGIKSGDRVFFYEYKTAKRRKDRPKPPVGAQGVVRVGIVIVSGEDYDIPYDIEYVNGTVADWCWRVPVEDIDADGFVSLRDLLEVIHYRENCYLRGFNAGTGVMRLSSVQGAELYRLFKNHPRLRRGT